MKVSVLIAGVADIRYPLHEIRLEPSGRLVESGLVRRLLSPYDEAALELALKLRDADPATGLSVFLLSGANDEAVLRAIAAFKPDLLEAVELTPCCPWDSQLTATQFSELLGEQARQCDLILVGREFGDADPGNFPAALAARLALPFLARVQYLEYDSRGGVTATRQSGTCEERTWVDKPAVLSVTNDKRSKLRHPLMKNVMMAKRMNFDSCAAPVTGSPGVTLRQLREAESTSREVNCRFVEGTPEAQAKQMARIVRELLE